MSAGNAFAVEDPSGYWATEKHESQIKISKCGADKICGSIFWMNSPNDPKGNLKLDKANEDESKRKNTLLGLQLITMKADDDEWKGTVYNPQNGKTYSATLKFLSKNELEVKGCVAYILCGGQTWTREEPRMSPGLAQAGVAHAVIPKAAAGTSPPSE